MDNSQVLNLMQQAILVAFKLAGPLLLISMAIGVLISILQAATQINEQTLTFVPKLIVIASIFLIMGGTMLEVLQDFAFQIFDLMLR